jgi:selenide,water dikinase
MNIRLTQTVQKGGCAAKISAEVLRKTLGSLNFQSTDPNVLIDGKNFDDAGIYQITPDLALVQTLDFFTPIVDSPFLFGQIAAVNALSDVYAMGGTPKTCMAILAFPLATLDPEIMTEVLAGAQSKIAESHATLVGGHSIDDDTLKFGLSVTGLVNPKSMWTNQTAKVGDQLILTKPLGTGTLTAGLKNSDYTEDQIREALDSMITLNSILDLIPDSINGAIHAATDITGFGLLGHAMQVAKASQVGMKLSFSKLPMFELALSSIRAENLTKAHRSNESYTKLAFKLNGNIDPVDSKILFDPQTSGGLLLSVHPDHAEQIKNCLKLRFKSAEIIGSVTPYDAGSSEAPIQIYE